MSNNTSWLIRHGQTTSNIGAWSCDPNELLLTEEGKAQALSLADKIVNRPDLIISSPLQRALQTAEPTRKKWSDVPVEIWPIQEFVYLSPTKYQHNTPEERLIVKQTYWQQAIPSYCDDIHCESFSDFMKRVEAFHHALLTQRGFLVIFGHGQFFKAFLYGCMHGFIATPAWMRSFRQWEVAEPMLNGEIIIRVC